MAEMPVYIPVEEAVRRYHLDRAALMRLVEAGKIRAVRIGEGVAVAEDDVKIATVFRQAQEQGDELVSMSEAARRLGINVGYIINWVNYGWLPVLGYGRRRAKLISYKQAQALAKLREMRGYHRGSRLIKRNQEL